MPRGRTGATCRRLALCAAAVAFSAATRPTRAVAQLQQREGSDDAEGSSLVPNPAPDASIPGASLITDILGWLKYGALAAAVAGLLIGGIATAVGYTGSNYGASSAGRRWLMGGIGAAIIAGLAHMVVITLYEAAA